MIGGDRVEAVKRITPPILLYTYSIREMRVLRDKNICPIKRNA